MVKESLQGDIFEVGFTGNYDLVLVFGHLGLNEMNKYWKQFQSRHMLMKNIDDPFTKLIVPTEIDDRWIQFVSAQNNNGISDNEFEGIIQDVFSWALKHQKCNIITTGISNTDHAMNTSHNKQSDRNRVKLIREICMRNIYSKLEITLISLNDSYVNHDL